MTCNVIFVLLLSYNDPPSLTGKTVKKEPGNEEGQQHFDDTDKLLQDFQEAQVDRVGSRPSSNVSSLSNASERDQHHLGICNRTKTKKLGAQKGERLIYKLQFKHHIIVVCMLARPNTFWLSIN